jgi:signal peptidase I
MNFNFELILFYLIIISGVISLIDILFLAKKRKQANIVKLPLLIDYSRSFFPVLVVVFLLRSFLFEPYRIPSGSLEPSLLTGDFIIVNKYDYGVRLPITHNKVMNVGEPMRGDIIVLHWPPKPSVLYIKRVIGLPGDHISYINKVLYVNNHEIPQTFDQNTSATDQMGDSFDVMQKQEDLLGVKHGIYLRQDRSAFDFKDIIVPQNMYFVMGDNRDDSADSRYFGFVPEKNIVGKAVLVWMSWDTWKHRVRWNRIGKVVR